MIYVEREGHSRGHRCGHGEAREPCAALPCPFLPVSQTVFLSGMYVRMETLIRRFKEEGQQKETLLFLPRFLLFPQMPLLVPFSLFPPNALGPTLPYPFHHFPTNSHIFKPYVSLCPDSIDASRCSTTPADACCN